MIKTNVSVHNLVSRFSYCANMQCPRYWLAALMKRPLYFPNMVCLWSQQGFEAFLDLSIIFPPVLGVILSLIIQVATVNIIQGNHNIIRMVRHFIQFYHSRYNNRPTICKNKIHQLNRNNIYKSTVCACVGHRQSGFMNVFRFGQVYSCQAPEYTIPHPTSFTLFLKVNRNRFFGILQQTIQLGRTFSSKCKTLKLIFVSF